MVDRHAFNVLRISNLRTAYPYEAILYEKPNPGWFWRLIERRPNDKERNIS
jgi:hypothetical protein